jgi:uncharacterized membrane protein YesL
MSGFLGIDYEKPGKGVPEDGSKEKSIVRFFKIIQRKFWAMIRVNLLHLVCSIPAFAVSAFVFSYMYTGLNSGNIEFDLSLRLFVGFVMVSMQLVSFGPLHAGFIYVLRNYAREENAFVWSDFIKGVKENWKRAFAVTLIDITVVFLVSYMYMFYNAAAGMGAVSGIFKVLLIAFGLIYAMMHIYIYPMMVTLDLTVRQLYSNAFRFALAKYLPNLGIVAAIAAFSLLLFINVILGLFIIMFVGYSLTSFLSTFYAYIAIDKYIISKSKLKQTA